MNHVKLGRIPQLVRSCAFAFGGRSNVHPPCLRNDGSFRPCRRSPTARRRRCGDSMASPCAARMLAASFFSPPTIPLRQRPRHQLGHWFIIRESSQQCPFAPVWRPVGRCVGSHSCRPHRVQPGRDDRGRFRQGLDTVGGGGNGFQPASTPHPLSSG